MKPLKAHLRTRTTEVETIVDENNIPLERNEKTIKYLTKSKEQFFLCYANLLSILSTNLTHPEIRVYAYILLNHSFGSAIGINKAVKEEMAKTMSRSSVTHSGVIMEGYSIAAGTISNALTGLVEKKLLFSPSKGLYKLNPRYAFKGSTNERNAMLKVILELECPDC